MRKYYAEVLGKMKALHKGTSPYHSRTNGKVERLNRIISTMLRKMLLNKPTKLWDLYLNQALFACRNAQFYRLKSAAYLDSLILGKTEKACKGK